ALVYGAKDRRRIERAAVNIEFGMAPQRANQELRLHTVGVGDQDWSRGRRDIRRSHWQKNISARHCENCRERVVQSQGKTWEKMVHTANLGMRIFFPYLRVAFALKLWISIGFARFPASAPPIQ